LDDCGLLHEEGHKKDVTCDRTLGDGVVDQPPFDVPGKANQHKLECEQLRVEFGCLSRAKKKSRGKCWKAIDGKMKTLIFIMNQAGCPR
jgi:hypothetical protein